MSEPLRIASVCKELPNPSDPSIGVFVLRRLEAMARAAVVDTIQPIPYFPFLKPLPEWGRARQREVGGLRIHPERMFYFPKVMKSLDSQWLRMAVARGLRRLQARHRVDLVDAHFGYPEGVGSFLAARGLSIPAFITFRGFEAEFVHKPLIGKQITNAIKQAAGLICVSHSLAEVALAHGAHPDRTVVIHNAIDGATFHPGDRGESRARLGVDADRPLVVSVGHLISRKRHHVVIEAFKRVLEESPDARLTIIGAELFEPRYPETLRRLVADLGIGASVTFAGNRPAAEVADWLRAADVFALGTQREGCCNAVLESLASGTPVVTTPVGDNAYFVKDGTNGFIVPVDDSEATAAAVSRALRVEWNRSAIAASLGVGGWDGVASQVLEFFRRRLAAGEGARER
jgi:glycosyltransferase involved in cell wall biosynthesis